MQYLLDVDVNLESIFRTVIKVQRREKHNNLRIKLEASYHNCSPKIQVGLYDLRIQQLVEVRNSPPPFAAFQVIYLPNENKTSVNVATNIQ